MGLADTTIAAVSTSLAACAAVASWRSSRQANATAETVARLERERRRRELTPRLTVKMQSPRELYIRLEGPSDLDETQVRLSIKDEIDLSRAPALAGGPTPEQRAEVIWGPCRFKLSTEGADRTGRTVAAFPMLPGDRRRFPLEPTVMPAWYTGPDAADRWQQGHADSPIRLQALCTTLEYEWRLVYAVPLDGGHARGGG